MLLFAEVFLLYSYARAAGFFTAYFDKQPTSNCIVFVADVSCVGNLDKKQTSKDGRSTRVVLSPQLDV